MEGAILDLFNGLESNQPQLVEDSKKKFHEHFNSVKESWLLNGMFEYYISTGSLRTVEILVGVREPHERYLFDKLSESLRGPQKIPALNLLGHVVRKHPTWLHKIVYHTLLKELLRLLKIETDIIPLMSALLIVIILLPIIAGLFGPFLQDLFEVFSRLAAWNTNNPNKVPEGHLIHLQIGLYALFNRLYGMYPCNFLSYLRQQYNTKENHSIFTHTIKPMLDRVRMHPLLVIATKDTEVAAERWKKMQANDVIIECAKFSVESGEKTKFDDCGFRARTSSFRSRSSLEYAGGLVDGCKMTSNILLNSRDGGVASYSMNLPDSGDVWSPSMGCGAPTPPESAPTSIPHTPIAQTYAVSTSFPQQEGTSPPEAAVEATPESTPVKDMRQTVIRAAPPPSNVVRALNSFAVVQGSGSSAARSQPSSPMKKEASPFRFPPQPSTPPVGGPPEPSTISPAQPSAFLATQKKIQKVVIDRKLEKESSRSASGPWRDLETPPGVGLRPKTPGSGGVGVGYQPSSPLRVIPLHPSPWGDIPHPPGPSVPGSPLLSVPTLDHSEEDREVESTMGNQPPTPTPPLHHPQVKRGDSVLHDGGGGGMAGDGEEFDDCTEMGCVEGGLHMPDPKSMMQFARRVHRLRFYSQCAPDTFTLNQIGMSSGSSPREGSLFPDLKVRRAISCPEMKKASSASNTMADLGVTALDKTVEEEVEDTTTLNGHVEDPLEHKRLVTCSTQTEEPPLEYEHLFLAVFPSIEQHHSAPPDIQSPPLFTATQSRFSPFSALESYIDTAVKTHTEKMLRHAGGESELKSCRDQIVLLTLQLQYERHRREVHAERNRRLLGKSRSTRALEEHNSALRDQVSLLQKEIEILRGEQERMKTEAKFHSDQIQQSVSYWQEQSSTLQKDLKEAKSQISLLEQELKDAKQNSLDIFKDYNSAQAAVFELKNTLRSVLAEANVGRGLRNELALLQHRVSVAGELEGRLKSRLAVVALEANAKVEKHFACQSYNSHVQGLQQHLDSQSMTMDALRARLNDSELALERRDSMIEDQKRLLEKVKEEHEVKVRRLEHKVDQLRESYQKKEEETLALLQEIEALELSGKKKTGSVTSQAGSPPLSTSLSPSGTLSLSDTPHIKNLQKLVDTTDPLSGGGSSREPQFPTL